MTEKGGVLMKRALYFLIVLPLIGVVTVLPDSARAQSNPAASLVGQRVSACKDGTRFDLEVVAADGWDTIIDRTAEGRWVVATVDATNRGPALEYLQGLVKVRDNRGRQVAWKLFNGADNYVETDLAEQYGVSPSWQGVEGGATMRTIIIFDVMSDAASLTLLASDLSCIPGAPAAPSPVTGAPAPASPAASTSPPAPPSVAPVPPSQGAPVPTRHPAAALVGQSVTACKGELRVRFTVVDADWRSAVVDRPAKAGAMWAIVVADITNLGPFTDGVQGLAKLRDDRGREYSWRLFNGLDIYVEDQIAAEFGLPASWELTTPGVPMRSVLLFEVAADARTLTLLPDNIGCGG